MTKIVNDLGMTGTSSQDLTAKQIDGVLVHVHKLNPMRVHHGVCIKADEQFHRLIKDNFPRIQIIGHPPINKSKMARGLSFHALWEPKEYLVRNRDIVNICDALIALPEGEEIIRSGTWSTVRYARKMKRPITIVYP